MPVDQGIKIFSLIVEIIKTGIPYGVIFAIFWIFKIELKTLIKNGGLRVTAPGFSLETSNQQENVVSDQEIKRVGELNQELEKSKKIQQKIEELQEYTARDKETFFLGYHFEKTYRLIFPSQLNMLKIMNNQNGTLPYAIAQAIHRRTVWANYFNVTYDQYVGFMVNSGLITLSGDNLTLTKLGSVFLDYLQNSNIPLKPLTDGVKN